MNKVVFQMHGHEFIASDSRRRYDFWTSFINYRFSLFDNLFFQPWLTSGDDFIRLYFVGMGSWVLIQIVLI